MCSVPVDVQNDPEFGTFWIKDPPLVFPGTGSKDGWSSLVPSPGCCRSGRHHFAEGAATWSVHTPSSTFRAETGSLCVTLQRGPPAQLPFSVATQGSVSRPKAVARLLPGMLYQSLSLPHYLLEPWGKALDTPGQDKTALEECLDSSLTTHRGTGSHYRHGATVDTPLYSCMPETLECIPSSCLSPGYAAPLAKMLEPRKVLDFRVIFFPSHPALGLWDVFTGSHHVQPGL